MKVWAKVSSAMVFTWSSSANRGEFRFRRLIVSEGEPQCQETLTLHLRPLFPLFQSLCLPKFRLKEGSLEEEAGASCNGRTYRKSHHTLTFELEWVWNGCDIPHVYSCARNPAHNELHKAHLDSSNVWYETFPRPHIQISQVNKIK